MEVGEVSNLWVRAACLVSMWGHHQRAHRACGCRGWPTGQSSKGVGPMLVPRNKAGPSRGAHLLSPLTFSHMTLHDLRGSPLCLPFHLPRKVSRSLRTGRFAAVFLSSVLLGCVLLNAGSRGRCWPWPVGSRSQARAHLPPQGVRTSVHGQGTHVARRMRMEFAAERCLVEEGPELSPQTHCSVHVVTGSHPCRTRSSSS